MRWIVTNTKGDLEMQVTRPADMTIQEATAQNKLRAEFFSSENDEGLRKKMNDRLQALERFGEVLVRRVDIEGHQIPEIVRTLVCGILGSHNKGQRQRLKSEAVKLIESL